MNEQAPPRSPVVFVVLGLVGCLACLLVGVGAGAAMWLGTSSRSSPPESVTVDVGGVGQRTEDQPASGRARLTLAARQGSAAELETAAGVLRQRLAASGIDGQVQVGDGRLVVDLPEDAMERAVGLLTAGGRLQFKLVARLEEEAAAAEIARIDSLKATRAYQERTEAHDVARFSDGRPLLLENPGVEGFLITKVYRDKDQNDQEGIGFVFGDEGRVAFRELSGSNIGRDLAIVLDGWVETVATIQSAIDGSGIITRGGGYKPEELQQLITVLGSGRLPVELSLEGE